MSRPSSSGERRIALPVALAVILALLPVGCGQGGTEHTASLSKAQFVKEGNALCARVFAEINQEYGRFSHGPNGGENSATEAERNQAAEEIVPPNLTRLLRRLRALGLPAEEGERVPRILNALQAGIEKGEEEPLALRGIKGFALMKPYEMLWAYGLTGCGLGS
jgi:hypothetical protein